MTSTLAYCLTAFDHQAAANNDFVFVFVSPPFIKEVTS